MLHHETVRRRRFLLGLRGIKMTEYKRPQVSKIQSLGPRRPTAPDLSYMGLGEIAYVRAVATSGAEVYGVLAANGEPIAAMADRELAMAATVQNDLVPVSVH